MVVAALLPLARDEERGDGDGERCPVSVGRALFHGENWLRRAGVPCRAGFQRRQSVGPWKVSAWAAGAGIWQGSRRGIPLPN